VKDVVLFAEIRGARLISFCILTVIKAWTTILIYKYLIKKSAADVFLWMAAGGSKTV